MTSPIVDALFVIGLLLPPAVVIVSMAVLALPIRLGASHAEVGTHAHAH